MWKISQIAQPTTNRFKLTYLLCSANITYTQHHSLYIEQVPSCSHHSSALILSSSETNNDLCPFRTQSHFHTYDDAVESLRRRRKTPLVAKCQKTTWPIPFNGARTSDNRKRVGNHHDAISRSHLSYYKNIIMKQEKFYVKRKRKSRFLRTESPKSIAGRKRTGPHSFRLFFF